MTLKNLGILHTERAYKSSSMPQHTWKWHHFSEKNANELTKAIIAFFELNEIKAWRQASEGRYIPGKTYDNVIGQRITLKGMYIPRSKAAKGIGDISSVIKGTFVSWEVKFGKDRQRSEQKDFQSDLEKSGGKYHLVKDWDGFCEQVKQYL